MDQLERIPESIAIARQAQQSWQQVQIQERAKRVARYAALVVRHRRELADGVLYPTRASYLETITAELIPLAQTAKWLGSDGPRILKHRKTSRFTTPMWLGSLRSTVQRVPRGIVLILGTWNYPIFLTGSQLLHALLAGNGVILKPSPGCEQVTAKLAQMCSECGIPAGLVQVIDSSVDAGKAAMQHGVDHVVMTGSSRSGRRVIEQSIANLCSSTLELSGSDAVFVLESADLERIANLLRFGIRLNGGATCIAPRRVFVLETMSERLCQLLREKLIDSAQSPWSTWMTQSTFEQLKPLVQAAESQGASMLLEWDCNPQNRKTLPYPQPQTAWIPTGPIVLSDVTPEMAIYGLDVFAPLLAIIPVRDIDQAVRYNKDCKYGLCASIFGREDQALSLARELPVGSVLINDFVVPTADPRLPFGGRGESGYGVTRGEEGLLEMTVPQVISIKRGKWLPHSDLPHAKDEQLLDGLLQFQHGGGWAQRISGLKKLLWAIRRKPN